MLLCESSEKLAWSVNEKYWTVEEPERKIQITHHLLTGQTELE